MREIKFRAWNPKEKIMCTLENRGLKWITLEKVDPTFQGNCMSFILGWYMGELMQYTGLKDKNSKEIYDGDIVKSSLYGQTIGVIEYRENFFCLCWDEKIWSKLYDINLEVIGNIYENPELMEAKPNAT